MCGINALFSKNNDIFDHLCESLYHLHHRGQDTFGFSYFDDNNNIHLLKKKGLIGNHNIKPIQTFCGIGHVRYPTSGKNTINECQPFYLEGNYHNISFVHNGHINYDKLSSYLNDNNIDYNKNITSDSHLLLYYLSHLLNQHKTITNDIIQTIVETIHSNEYIVGSYNCICLIDTYGLICFKDKYSIRPLILGKKNDNYIISSESISITSINYEIINDIYNNDIITFDNQRNFHKLQLSLSNDIKPCIFEWIYLAREESILYGVNVYESRLKMGEFLAKKIINSMNINNIDHIIPIPDTSKPVALEIAKILKKPYYEAITKNRYVNRTFIMNTQNTRKKNIKRKLNVIKHLIYQKNVLIVDDSIVRGNTIKHIIKLLKDNNVNKIFIAVSSPKIINKNIYGLDIPNKEELLSYNKSDTEIEKELQIEKIFFQNLNDLISSINHFQKLNDFETSIFH